MLIPTAWCRRNTNFQIIETCSVFLHYNYIYLICTFVFTLDEIFLCYFIRNMIVFHISIYINEKLSNEVFQFIKYEKRSSVMENSCLPFFFFKSCNSRRTKSCASFGMLSLIFEHIFCIQIFDYYIRFQNIPRTFYLTAVYTMYDLFGTHLWSHSGLLRDKSYCFFWVQPVAYIVKAS